MPRSYTRVSQRKSWNEDQIKAALNCIQERTSIRKAAKQYNIPESTLRDKMKTPMNLNPALGRKPTFNELQEQEIAEHVIRLANLFYGLSPIELRRVAFEFAEKNNIKNNFNKEKS